MKLTQNTTAVAIMNQAFGDDWLEKITDTFGYQTQVVNPDWVEPEGFDENSDTTESFMDNPTDRTSFLDAILLDEGLQGVLDRMLEVDVQVYKRERRAAFDQAREAIKASV